MWDKNNLTKNNKFKKKIQSILDFKDFLFIKNNVNFIELYDNGYADAKKNKLMLDNVFLPSQI
jgi:hypothetical protein